MNDLNREKLAISETDDGDEVLLELAGRLDYISCSLLTKRIAGTIESGHDTIYIHLRQVLWIDSSGIGALIGALSLCRRLGRSLILVMPSDQVFEVLSRTKMAEFFSILESDQELKARFPHSASPQGD